MTWRSSIVIEWKCDHCGAEVVSTDDSGPEGWLHTDAGYDLCGECRA